MSPKRVERVLITAVLTCCTFGALCAVAEAATKKRGVQRLYSGARWSPPGPVAGYHATLRLDSARARDYGRRGYIAQTLWAATNEGEVAYGRNVRAPYFQVSVSRGYRGRSGLHIVSAARLADGRYTEGRSRGPAIEYGQDYSFSMIGEIGGVRKVKLGPEEITEGKGLGDKFGSLSAYAGLESTSSLNCGEGRVSKLGRRAVQGNQGSALFPEWNLAGDRVRAKLVSRGRGSARWEDRDYELVNSFGGCQH